MVVHEQFPLFRLATLLARQLSSPIATRIKEYAKSHPRFGRSVCMRSGRAAAAAELRFKLWTLRMRGAGAALPALSDQRALDAGADLLGEMIIFALGAGIVTFEYNRQAIKQEAKVDAERSAWLAVQLQVEEVQRELQAQQRDLDRLAARLRTLTGAGGGAPGLQLAPAEPAPRGVTVLKPEVPVVPHETSIRDFETRVPAEAPGVPAPLETRELLDATENLCPCPEPEPSTEPPL